MTLTGFVLLTLGGWLGGTIVFVYGMRVLGIDDASAAAASASVPPERIERAA